jgi:Flp pilus assembly protein protease CpaA
LALFTVSGIGGGDAKGPRICSFYRNHNPVLL